MTAPAIACPPAALDIYDRALARAATGAGTTLLVRDPAGRTTRFDAADWCRDHRPGDTRLLDRCTGATLDVGCGPGRLTGALLRRGRAALGIDVSAAAVRLARARGALALRRDVFAPLPGHGRWDHLLLADGNIGIGGDPVALLRRCHELLAPAGRVHAELAAPGTGSWSGAATLHTPGEPAGAPLRWAQVAADDLAAVAREAGLTVLSTWTEEGRWFASLTGRGAR
ncbi:MULTISPECIES: methyltransferase domain-containing protein [unclassified Actinoplanes]|uniref:methyltransferase domain-containing protein n=1 Tax=unclassified Actinoplanes TaxID=2626549 RepID=UPI00030FE506|nr:MULTISPECIES: class I SAM-dependent methyltransferase [unclassified Actinoplanes]